MLNMPACQLITLGATSGFIKSRTYLATHGSTSMCFVDNLHKTHALVQNMEAEGSMHAKCYCSQEFWYMEHGMKKKRDAF